ncbi:expressed hypothetical protein [Trichoplax adhaerens]|uniref:2,4-dienoyl-CoA reductase n=1 Tax=Trichoplax adhaerens TaxID=10228 RepID=B3S7E9_TRIAD|nr:expressed hypothetical protein [Trichoplax adhaerens]EDV21186.1 expressed hypothetical protein [Trichoplax adhaerens]|eukprot:XP_002116153.1 expressed hypothetical protein [Trichoplax adhaerens]
MLPPGTFNGKVAFITGGGTGIGKGIATNLSRLGASVVITSRKIDVLEKTAAEISDVYPIQADVRDATAVTKAVDQCLNEVGLPTLIVNNAAGNFVSPTERLSANAFRTIVEIVLLGSSNVTLEIGKRLIEAQKAGAFVSISTTYADVGSGFVVPSACSKAGVNAMVRSLAAEWGRYGMRFNAIAPGAIETKGAMSRLDPTGGFYKKAIERTPAGRCGQIGELANLASYLLSDYANWLSGEVINLDGGEMAYMAGQMNALSSVSSKEWDLMEKAIRSVKGS